MECLRVDEWEVRSVMQIVIFMQTALDHLTESNSSSQAGRGGEEEGKREKNRQEKINPHRTGTLKRKVTAGNMSAPVMNSIAVITA